MASTRGGLISVWPCASEESESLSGKPIFWQPYRCTTPGCWPRGIAGVMVVISHLGIHELLRFGQHHHLTTTPRDREDSPIPHATPLSLLQAVALLCAPFQIEMFVCGIVSPRVSIVARHRGENTTDEVRPVARVRPHAMALCGTSRTQLARCMLVGHGSLERICEEPSYLRTGPCFLVIAAPKLLGPQ